MKIVLKLSLPARRYPYRGGRRMRRALGRDLAATIASAPIEGNARRDTAQAVNHTPPAHKFARHLSIYESVLDRTKPIRMLAFGSFYENSLKLWQEYIHPASLIVWSDVQSKLLKIAESGKVYVRVYDEPNGPLMSQLTSEFGPFDVILDAGSKASSHMVDSFRYLFMTALGDGGVYIVEDVGCDYQTPYRDSRLSFIDLVKALIDAMHAHYQAASNKTSFRVGHAGRIEEVPVPAITPVLGGIEIYDSIVVVRRTARPLTSSTQRP